MMNKERFLTSLTDDQLLTRVKTLAEQERHSTAALIAALVELDARRLYLGQGYASLFEYCRKELRLSEDAAYNRVRAARVAAKWPIVLDKIADRSLSVTAVRLLSGVLTGTNHEELLVAACGKSKRDVEVLVATHNPQPPIAASVRKIATPAEEPVDAAGIHPPLLAPAPAAPSEQYCDERASEPTPIAKPPSIAPLSAEHFKIQFTIPKATYDKLRRIQDLTRHTNPKGDPAVIFDRALTVLLEQLEKTKLGKTTRPMNERRATATASRHVPSAVKREVWTRDRGQCAFIGTAGRCDETGFLEYHHVVPFADGGETTVANIELRCRAHNAYEAEGWFGPLVVRESQPPHRFG